MSALELRGAERRYGEQVALAATDLTVAAGEKIALLGPSGSGKSTVLGLLAGSLAPSGGSVHVDGRSIAQLSSRGLRGHRARCSLVPQDSALVEQLSVHRNVMSGLLPTWRWPRVLLSALWPLEGEKVQRVLEPLGLGDRQAELVSNLSGGEQRRVAVARALVRPASLVLADEPTAALDPHYAELVVRALAEHAVRCGAALVVCTHWFSLVQRQVDRVLGLRAGRVVLDKPTSAVSEADLAHLYAGSDELR